MKTLLITNIIIGLVFFSISSCGGGGLCQGQCKGGSPDLNPQDFNVPKHTIFVTSIRYSGNVGTLGGADTLCQNLAKEGKKTRDLPGSWHAIISDSSTHAKDRILLKNGEIINNTNGETVFALTEQLWNGSLAAPVKYDQNGEEILEKLEVWTATQSDGTRTLGPSLVTNCTDWKDGTTMTNGGHVGRLDSINASWLQSDDWIGCAKTDEKARLYCINSF